MHSRVWLGVTGNDTEFPPRATLGNTAKGVKWSLYSLKYLGVNISVEPKDLYSSNYEPLLESTQRRLESWGSRSHSWMGRMALLKMDILPRFLYIFQTVPIKVPNGFFRRLRMIFLGYVWKSTGVRVKYDILIKCKEQGGVGLPHMEGYYQVVTLNRIMDWFQTSQIKLWTNIQQEGSVVPLTSLPWIPPEKRPRSGSLSMVISSVLSVWDKLVFKPKISTYVGPLTPILGNPEFPQGIGCRKFLKWEIMKPSPIIQAIGEQAILPLMELLPVGSPVTGKWFQYLQLKAFFTSLSKPDLVCRDLTSFEDMCLNKPGRKHAIAYIYHQLLKEVYPSHPLYIREWERELGYRIGEEEWRKAFWWTFKASRSVRFQEKNFKILARWYRCPTILHRFNPLVTKDCWRCGKDEGSMLHIWCSCQGLKLFWESIFEIMNKVLEIHVPATPEVALLSMFPETLPKIKRKMMGFILSAARVMIPRYWRREDLPQVKEWEYEVNTIMRLEEVVARSNNKYMCFLEVWKTWTEFAASTAIQKFLI